MSVGFGELKSYGDLRGLRFRQTVEVVHAVNGTGRATIGIALHGRVAFPARLALWHGARGGVC
eukprot:1223655-Pyramimonas_sp.AAC.1